MINDLLHLHSLGNGKINDIVLFAVHCYKFGFDAAHEQLQLLNLSLSNSDLHLQLISLLG